MTIGSALLSPTRTYAPLIAVLSNEFKDEIKGIVHCSGGGQTKCLRFGRNIHFVKDQLFEVPPLFKTIQLESNTSWHEMYKTFNMGHRMELYIKPRHVDSVISLAKSFKIEAKIIGYTEWAKNNCLTLKKGNQMHRTHLASCSYADYQMASTGEMPDRWWNTFQKLG